MLEYNKYSDTELLALLSNDDKHSDDAFRVIYEKYSAQIYGYSIYRSNSLEEAQEINQEAWISFYNAMKNGAKTNKILPYLMKIVRNKSIDRFRNERSSKNISFEHIEPDHLERIADPFN